MSPPDPATLHGPLRPIDRACLDVDAPEAAQHLLGAVLERAGDTEEGPIRARIVEVEAYGPDDPASHSFRGPTPRCASMFAASGTAYVYRSYGIHWCLNVSVGGAGVGAAVLVRAAVLLEGDAVVRSRRPHVVSSHALLRGPGCLSTGLAVDGGLDGADLVEGVDGLRLLTDEVRWDAGCGPRVGISQAPEVAWRWFVPNCEAVSRYRRSPNAEVGEGGR